MGYALEVPKEDRICVRVSVELKAEIEAAAAKELQPVSTFFLGLYAKYRREQEQPSPLPSPSHLQQETPQS